MRGWVAPLAALVLATTLVYVVFSIRFAYAHDWYTGTKDPVSNLSCCGGYDCAPVTDSDVRPTHGGYIFLPTGEFIENERAQPAHDWQYHRCIFQSGKNAGQTRCFFIPGKSM